MKTCVTCQHFDLRELPKLAAHGFAWCQHQNIKFDNGSISKAVVVSASREICEKFQEAPAEAGNKRIEWIKQREVR